MFKKYLLFMTVLVLTHTASAEVLFEGYFKVSQFKKHIGFYILKQEIDAKNKQFKTTSFMKLGKNGFDLTESLQAISTTDFLPISYTYLATDGKKSTSIDATFKNLKMTGFLTENGEKKKLTGSIPKGSFLSSSLYYMMLNSKDGLKTGATFEFTAVAEERADALKGTATVDKKMVSEGALQLLRIKNNFAGSEYENLITPRGENYSANTPATGIDTILVKNSEEAVQGIKVSASTLEKIFGQVPQGKTNILQQK